MKSGELRDIYINLLIHNHLSTRYSFFGIDLIKFYSTLLMGVGSRHLNSERGEGKSETRLSDDT